MELSALPVGIEADSVPRILDQLITDMQNDIPDYNFSPSDLLAKSFAKSLALKNGKPLSVQEQEFIVNSLFACKEPNISPEKQTIFITLTTNDLDAKFNLK